MKYLLGIDGGGTGTKITAADRHGNILTHMSAGALNGNGQSPDSHKEPIGQIARPLAGCG